MNAKLTAREQAAVEFLRSVPGSRIHSKSRGTWFVFSSPADQPAPCPPAITAATVTGLLKKGRLVNRYGDMYDGYFVLNTED